MATAKPGCWSYSAGKRGKNRVRAFAKDDGRLFIEFYENGKRKRVALGHRDRNQAETQADEVAAGIARQEPPKSAPSSLRTLFENYGRGVTPTKAAETQRHDRVCFEMFSRFFGPNTRAESLSRTDWDKFIRARRDGRIGPLAAKAKPVGNRMIAYDLKTLRAVLKWATESRDSRGHFYLDKDPLKGLPYPQELNTQRPIVTEQQYQALLSTACGMNPTFKLLLVIVHETGHRIGAVRQLRWADVDLELAQVTWPASTDKMGRTHVTPLTDDALRALKEARSGIGNAWIFPAPSDPEQPCSRHTVDQWLERGVQYAGLQMPPRFGWHSFRRKFATDLKDVPLRDLMAAGGWQSPDTVVRCYQQPEQDKIREALAARSRSRKAS